MGVYFADTGRSRSEVAEGQTHCLQSFCASILSTRKSWVQSYSIPLLNELVLAHRFFVWFAVGPGVFRKGPGSSQNLEGWPWGPPELPSAPGLGPKNIASHTFCRILFRDPGACANKPGTHTLCSVS